MRLVAALLVLTALACRPAASGAPARPASATPHPPAAALSSPPGPVVRRPVSPAIPDIGIVCATTDDGRVKLRPAVACGCGVEVTCTITRHRDIVNLTVRYKDEEMRRFECLECWHSESDGCTTDPLPPNSPVRIAVAGYYFGTLTTDDHGRFPDDCVTGRIPP